jgi:hypothetical protein
MYGVENINVLPDNSTGETEATRVEPQSVQLVFPFWKGKVTTEARDALILGAEKKSIVLSEGSQASPTSPSGKDSMKAKWLRWLKSLAWDRGRGIVILWINCEMHNFSS